MNKSVDECLIVGVDFSPNDTDMMMVMRKRGDETHIINLLKDEDAREVYNKLIGAIDGQYGDINKLKYKQKPMEVLKTYDDEMKTYYCFCPNCNKYLGWVYTVKSKYCSECGQRIGVK